MDNGAPISQPLISLFAHRKGRFSDFWFLIFQARLLLCVVVVVFATVTMASLLRVIAGASIYLAINVGLGLLRRRTLRRKRIRVFPAVLDVAFTSYLVFLTGGESSVWYLLYIFPVLSVSRYLSYEGSVVLALMAALSYSSVALHVSGLASLPLVIIKSLILLGISFVAGNLSRTRKRKDDDLVDVFRKIDNAIIDNFEVERLLRMILESAVAFTESGLGQMTVSGEEQLSFFVSVKSDPKQPDWQVQALANRFQAMVRQSKQPLSVLQIKQKRRTDNVDVISHGKKAHIYVLNAYVDDSSNAPRSALFVPLVLNSEVRAIISLYSQDRFHYFDIDAVKLESLAPALGITLKHSSEIEKTQRLKLLHKVGEVLKVEQGLKEVFDTVVELTWTQLNSEEAALFVSDDIGKGDVQIRKVAVWGPTREIAEQLELFEPPYRPGESLVGEIFKSKQPRRLPEVPVSTLHYDKYSQTLPSKAVRHYIGVPIIIGDQVLGVLRVINKRSSAYSINAGNYELAEAGFDNEDLELMQTIASQVASAIRSAKFIEVHRYYQELVENSPDPIIVLDQKGFIKVFNRACEMIWGCSEDEAVGKHVSNYYESEEHAREIGGRLDEDAGHRLQDFEARIKACNGGIIPISLSAALLYDAKDQKVGSIGVFKDLRAAQKLQEEKTNAERLATLGKLAHTVGHEIKHDIAVALNYIDVLAYEARDDADLSQAYREIQDSLGEAVDKFQNMLLVGRPRPPEIAVIGAADVFRLIEPSMRRRGEAVDVDLDITYPDENLELAADIGQLRQVFLNLFDNSLDAIDSKRMDNLDRAKGRIECVSESENGNLRIEWTDNGCGISMENLDTVFTPFVTSKATGNGLGLFIVRNIIEKHGGSVSVASGEGKRTTFTISLPLLREEP
jgi:PAS domain S-box-containing protein